MTSMHLCQLKQRAPPFAICQWRIQQLFNAAGTREREALRGGKLGLYRHFKNEHMHFFQLNLAKFRIFT